MKKGHSGRLDGPNPAKAAPEQKPVPQEGRPEGEKQRPATVPWALLSPLVMFLVYVYIWYGPTVVLEDPWDAAVTLMDSTANVQDPVRRQGMLEKSGAELKQLSELHPYHARVHFLLGRYYIRTGQFQAAIEEAKEAIRLGSGAVVNRVDGIARDLLVEATLKRAHTFLANGDLDGTLGVLRDSYPAAPDNAALLLALGKVSFWKKDGESASRYLKSALEVDPKNAEAYMFLGKTANLQGRIPDAIEYLGKAVVVNPRLTEAKDLLTTLKSSAQFTH
jgi:tetratricopeptide (TPR) repeat protein